MSPSTKKLLKNIVRALKGVLTAIDKWIDEKGNE